MKRLLALIQSPMPARTPNCRIHTKEPSGKRVRCGLFRFDQIVVLSRVTLLSAFTATIWSVHQPPSLHSQLNPRDRNMQGKTTDEWIEEYAESHQHPVNRLCHLLGIPMILISLALIPVGYFTNPWIFRAGVLLFVGGWVLQFVGHAIEGKPPEFLQNWRFLLIGTKWWWKKMFEK